MQKELAAKMKKIPLGFDDSNKEDKIGETSSQKSGEHTASPPHSFTNVHESIPTSTVSRDETAPIITPLQVRHPHNYTNWFHDSREKEERYNSIIAEREIDLEKAKGKPNYDNMKSDWEKEKEKTVVQPQEFFRDRCRTSMSTWERSFSNNSIRDADLIFVLVHLDNHLTVLVINILRETIEDIDNHSDNKSFERYKSGLFDRAIEVCHILGGFLEGDRINRKSVHGLHHWPRRTIVFPWRNNQNSYDCGY